MISWMISWIFCADKSVRASMTYDASVTFVETKIYGKSSRELKGAAAGLTDVVQAELLAKSTSFPHGYHATAACAVGASLITQEEEKKRKERSLRIAAPDSWATWPGCPPRVTGVSLKYQ